MPDAILYANRALARLNLGKLAESVEDSEAAISLDPNYVKGYWRKGQGLVAMGDHKGALVVFEKGLKIEPANKALKKEVDKTRAKVEQQGLFDDGPPPISPATKAEKRAEKKVSSKSSSSSSKSQAKASSAPPSTPTRDEEEDAAMLSKSDHVRGYKITKDGKKTSFFTHEQTEEEKALIGDIAPKRIDNAAAAATPAALKNEKGVSSWNSAGTWEEKDLSKWADESMRQKLDKIEYSGGGIKVNTTKVKLEEASASVATVRGKRRFLYEFVVVMSWEAEVEGTGGTGKGSLVFNDVAPDCDGEFEAEIKIEETDGEGTKNIRERVKGDRNSYREKVEEKMNEWAEEFVKMYS
jgi:tetratricopeptide (TPR) repeat protein